MLHRFSFLSTCILILTSCSESGNLTGGGAGAGGAGGTITSCSGDPDHPTTCTNWTCMNTPSGEISCTSNNPPGSPHPGGSYTCPGSNGGLYCPGNGAGGSGPWMCHADDVGTLTCTRGGGTPGSGGTDGGLPPMPMLCQMGGINNEPGILVGYQPAMNQSVGANGQIKVWVNDEGAPIIAPGEMVDPNTGAITMPGDRTARAADGYLWEPALYIAPMTAENGGTPHFPTAIKGSYNPTTTRGPGLMVAGMDPPPPGSQLLSTYTGEDIWDVSSLGLQPGTYIAEFVIHDGDRDRGVGCVTITIQ